MREKRNVDRLIAFVMAMIMILSLIVYDNRFSTNAKVASKDSEGNATIRVEEIIAEAKENEDFDIENMDLSAIFGGDSLTVQGEPYFLYEIEDIENIDDIDDIDIDSLPEELEQSLTIDTQDGADGEIYKVALFTEVSNEGPQEGGEGNDATTTEELDNEEENSDATTTEATGEVEEGSDISTTEADEEGDDATTTEANEEGGDVATTEADEEGDDATTTEAGDEGDDDATTTETDEEGDDATTTEENGGEDETTTTEEENNSNYKCVGILTLYKDDKAPEISNVNIIADYGKVSTKDGYYLVTKDAVLLCTVDVSDPGDHPSGVEKVVFTDQDGNESTPLEGENGTYSGLITEAGVYMLRAYDNAGNEATYDDQKIDVKNPNEITSVKVDVCEKKEGNVPHYLLIAKDRLNQDNKVEITVTITQTEESEQIVSIERYLHYNIGNPNAAFDEITNQVTFIGDTATFEIPLNQASSLEEGLSWLTLYITDELGQHLYPAFDLEGHIIFIEQDDPELTAEISLKKDTDPEIYDGVEYNNGLSTLGKWAKEIALTIRAKGNSSFIKKVSYFIDNDTTEYILNIDDGNTDSTDGFLWDNTNDPLVLKELLGENSDGPHTLTFTVEDYFGNQDTYTTTLYLDTTQPEITATSETFGKSVKDLPTTVIDGNEYYCLTENGATETITVKALDGEANVSSGIKQLTVKINGVEQAIDEGEDTFTITESTPGYYLVTITALDYAGNESVPFTFGFMINNSDIETTLNAVGGDSANLGGKGSTSYTRFSGAEITYTATGLGLSAGDIQNNSKGPADINWNAARVEDDTNDPEIKIITITGTLPDVEGIYDISFSATKPGSTEVAVSDSMRIIYDKTAPSGFELTVKEPYGTVAATPNTYYFKTTPKVHVKIKDNYSLESFVLSDDQDPKNSWVIVDPDTAIEAKADEGVVKEADIELTKVKNKPFQLSYEAEDKAENHINQSIEDVSIVYDDIDPEITVSEVEKWNKKDVSLVVEASDEFYVSKLVTEVTRNGEKVEALSGEYPSFIVGKETTNTLTYSDQGVYKVTMKVYDAAGNESDAITREFVIDKTDPTVSAKSAAFGGRSVEEIPTTDTYNGKNYYCLTSEDASETITVTASDGTEVYSSGIKQLIVTINGVEQEIAEGESTFTFTETESGYYDITVKAIDNAGNESRLLEFGFMINREEIETRLSAEVLNTETEEWELLGESGSSSYTRFKGAVITYTATGLGLSADDITNATDSSLGIIWKDPVVTEDAENSDLKTITITGTLPDVEEIYDISFSVKKPGSQSGRVSDSLRVIYDKTIPFDFILTVEKPYGTVEETPGIYYFSTVPTILVEIKDNYSIESFVLADDQTPEHKWIVIDKEKDDPIEVLNGNVEITDYELELTNAVKNELFQLSYEVGDIAGNYITKEIQDRFVYDVEAPEITVHDVDYWNGGDVTLNVEVEDAFYVSRLETEVTCNGEKITGLSGDYADYATFTVAKATQNTLDYSEEGVYSVAVTAYDAAGNPSETITKTFVIDKTPPVIEWTGIPTEPNRSNQNVTVGFTVKDEYGIDPENTRSGNQSKVKITRYYETFDGIKGRNTVTISEASAKKLSASSICGQMNQKASSYYFEIEAIDNAGNSDGVIRTPRFYIDRTAPAFTITPIPSQTNDGYYNKTVSFNINVTEQYAYTHSIRIIDKNASVNGGNCISPANSRFSGKTGTCNVSVNPANAVSGTFALTVIVTDIFGNESQRDINFVIDKQKPVITLGNVASVNRENVTVPIAISDDYKYGTYNIEVVRLDAAGREVYHNKAYRTGKWDGSSNINFAETFSEEGDYTVTVTAIDKAGNSAVAKTTSFRIDKNAPVLSITGVNDVQATACTATMSIDESFDMGYNNSSQFTSADVVITRRTDSSPETTIANLTYSNFSAGNPHTATYSFSEDGIYTITFDATDATGNRAPTLTKTFKVDTTAPVLNVSVADRNAKTVESYEAIGSQANEDPNYVVMSVSVEELFYTTNKVTFTVMKDGVDVSNRYFAAYANRGEISSVSQIFEEDGVYTVKISAVDELGNAAEEYSIVFKVDNTPPTLEKTNVLNAFLAKADANGNILLNAEDFAAIAEMGYEALWDVNDTSVFTVDVKMDGVAFIDFSDLSDGYHKLTITVTDEVGQQSIQEFEFIYDGTAPRIIITGIENGESTTEPFTLTISLEDPEDMITRIVINGNDVDPALYQETNRYEYAVEEYGDYEIIVNATDIAGNTSSTYNSKTGEIFSFQLKEETNFVFWLIIIIAGVLLLGGVIILVAKSKKKQ